MVYREIHQSGYFKHVPRSDLGYVRVRFSRGERANFPIKSVGIENVERERGNDERSDEIKVQRERERNKLINFPFLLQ